MIFKKGHKKSRLDEIAIKSFSDKFIKPAIHRMVDLKPKMYFVDFGQLQWRIGVDNSMLEKAFKKIK